MPELDQLQTMESDIFGFISTRKEPSEKCTAMQDTGKPLTFLVASKAVQYVDDIGLQAYVLCDGKWQIHESRCKVRAF